MAATVAAAASATARVLPNRLFEVTRKSQRQRSSSASRVAQPHFWSMRVAQPAWAPAVTGLRADAGARDAGVAREGRGRPDQGFHRPPLLRREAPGVEACAE